MLPAALAHELLSRELRLGALATLVLLALMFDMNLLPWRLPQNARQVPSSIIARTDGSGALQFGFEMGTALRTFVPTQLPYVAAAAALLVSPWWATTLMGAGFGGGRVIMVRSTVSAGSAEWWSARFRERRGLILVINWAAALTCLVALAALALGGDF